MKDKNKKTAYWDDIENVIRNNETDEPVIDESLGEYWNIE